MKRFLLSLAALFATFSMISAQDIASATQTARLANEALTAGNYTEALAGFTSALAAANSCGEAGESLATVCKGVIPRIVSAIAKQKLQENEYDAAITGFTQAVALAKEYGDAETVTSATALIPQAYMKKGLAQLNASEYAAAEEAYKKALELDPTNGVAALRYGMALEAQGKADAALDSYRKAAEDGQQANAYAQLGKHFLRSAADYLKSKEYDEAVMDAVKSFEYVANPQALQIAGQASQMSGKLADAVKYFEQYLNAAPNAANAGQVAYTVGALCQQLKNTAKAKEFFTKAVSDPKYGAEAKKALDALK